MTNRNGRTVAALCGGAAVLALGLCGIGSADVSPISVTGPARTVAPPPPSPADGGAVPVHPVGGGGCVLGLNCGPIHPNPPPPPKRHPSLAPDPQHAAAAPQTP